MAESYGAEKLRDALRHMRDEHVLAFWELTEHCHFESQYKGALIFETLKVNVEQDIFSDTSFFPSIFITDKAREDFMKHFSKVISSRDQDLVFYHMFALSLLDQIEKVSKTETIFYSMKLNEVRRKINSIPKNFDGLSRTQLIEALIRRCIIADRFVENRSLALDLADPKGFEQMQICYFKKIHYRGSREQSKSGEYLRYFDKNGKLFKMSVKSFENQISKLRKACDLRVKICQ